jgi:hypothetical protein
MDIKGTIQPYPRGMIQTMAAICSQALHELSVGSGKDKRSAGIWG